MKYKKENKDHYRQRFNKVFDYIDRHIDTEITLEDLSSVANFSKFHFSRMFSATFRETPYQFIQRARLERSNILLRLKPKATVSETAFSCGFNNLSVFSRQFASKFGKSPTAFRNQKFKDRNNSQTILCKAKYLCSELKNYSEMEQLLESNIKSFPEMSIAYIRHVGPYNKSAGVYEKLFNKLFEWAAKKNLMKHNPKSIIIHHDDPDVTPDEKQRMSICITVPPETKTEGEIGKTEIPSGKYYVAKFELKPQEIDKAWNWIYGAGIPLSGYHPADQLPFQIYPEPPKNGKLTIEFCIPIEKS